MTDIDKILRDLEFYIITGFGTQYKSGDERYHLSYNSLYHKPPESKHVYFELTDRYTRDYIHTKNYYARDYAAMTTELATQLLTWKYQPAEPFLRRRKLLALITP